jgi:hypothetical protein
VDKARGIHVRQLRASGTVEHSDNQSVMFLSRFLDAKTFQVVDELPKIARLFLTHPMEEPGVRLRND